MGDTESGTWTSQELGGYMRREEARRMDAERRAAQQTEVKREVEREREGWTPGPWQVKAEKIGPKTRQVNYGATDADGWFVADTGESLDDKAEANANLIAAAPELYEALDLARATIERLKASYGSHSVDGTLDVIAAALRKARGES